MRRVISENRFVFAGQYRTPEMDDDLLANMIIDGLYKGLDTEGLRVARFDLPVEYGNAPKTKP